MILNLFEVTYWHSLNKTQDFSKSIDIEVIFTNMWANALFTKVHCTSIDEANVFYAFIAHNYPKVLINSQTQTRPLGDQLNWFSQT